jgi:hypothetical protein
MGVRWLLPLFFGCAVLVAGAGVAAGAGASATTGTPPACTDAEAERTGVSQSSVHAAEPTITTDDPALLSGQVVTPPSNPCDTVVQLVLSVPATMYVSGTDDVQFSTQGKLTATFRLRPGEARSIGARVYASTTGEHPVVADFRYYPVGHPEDERRLSGFTMEITAAAPNPGPTTAGPSPESDDGGPPLLVLAGGLLLLLVALAAVR